MKVVVQLLLLPLLGLLGGCPALAPTDEEPRADREIELLANGHVVVRGARLDLGVPEERDLVLRYARYWKREQGEKELLIAAAPGASGKMLIALTGALDEAGLSAYRIAKGEVAPPANTELDGPRP